MTTDEARRLISDIKCPPFRIAFDCPRNYVHIQKPDVEDVNNPGCFGPILQRIHVDIAYLDKQTLLDIIRESLHDLVTHEVDEWFNYQGRRIYDPHKVYAPVTESL